MSLSLLVGLAMGAGLLGIIVGLFIPPATRTTSVRQVAGARLRVMFAADASGTRNRKLLIGLVLGVLTWLITGWVVAILVLPAAAVVVPSLFSKPDSAAALTKLTALETWTRGLAGMMASRRSLEDAIHDSVRSAPAAIRPAVTDLSRRVRAQVPLDRALRAFANDLADPLGDTIAEAITIGSGLRVDRGGGGTAAALDELARAVADEVSARTAVENQRSSPRTSLRTVSAIALVAAIAGAFSGRLEGYSTPTGQIALVVIAAAFLGCLAWARRITAGEPPVRLYAPAPLEGRP